MTSNQRDREGRIEETMITAEVVPSHRLSEKPVEPYQNAVAAWLDSLPNRCFVCEEHVWLPGLGAPPPAYVFFQEYADARETWLAGLCYACCTRPDREAALNAAIEKCIGGARQIALPVDGPKRAQ